MSSPPDEPTPPGLEEPLGRFLERVAAPGQAPTSGAAAAVTGALAAALARMSARVSTRQRPDAQALADRAAALTDRLAQLAADDTTAVNHALDASRGGPPDSRERWHSAAQVPIAIAGAAAETAVLAAELAASGNPRLRGDAVTAALLADAVARSCVVLVGLHVAGATAEPDDDEPALLAAVRRHAFYATAAARAALANLPEAVAPEAP